MLRIACDGSCLGNPGAGGWAAVIGPGTPAERVLSGGEARTTNNRMELTAAIRAVEAAPEGTPATVVSDSQYVVKGITEWLPRWQRRNWKTAGRRPVRNEDLWRRLAAASARRPAVRFEWVQGHAGDPGNERAHELAFAEAQRQTAAPAPTQQPSLFGNR